MIITLAKMPDSCNTGIITISIKGTLIIKKRDARINGIYMYFIHALCKYANI